MVRNDLLLATSMKRFHCVYIMLLISDNCRLHIDQVVIRDKLIIR